MFLDFQFSVSFLRLLLFLLLMTKFHISFVTHQKKNWWRRPILSTIQIRLSWLMVKTAFEKTFLHKFSSKLTILILQPSLNFSFCAHLNSFFCWVLCFLIFFISGPREDFQVDASKLFRSRPASSKNLHCLYPFISQFVRSFATVLVIPNTRRTFLVQTSFVNSTGGA